MRIVMIGKLSAGLEIALLVVLFGCNAPPNSSISFHDAMQDGAILDGAILDGGVFDGAIFDGAVFDAAESSDASTTCIPECASDRVCGGDGCGGDCGQCVGQAQCFQDGTTCLCVPNCSGRVCGPDGCGGTCGQCTTQATCNSDGASCTDQGFGESCATAIPISLGDTLNGYDAGTSTASWNEVFTFQVPEAGEYQFSLSNPDVLQYSGVGELAVRTDCGGSFFFGFEAFNLITVDLSPNTDYYLFVQLGSGSPDNYQVNFRRVENLYSNPLAAVTTVAIDNTHIYWIEGSGNLFRMTKEGSTPTLLASGVGALPEMIVDSSDVFVLDRSAGTILRIPKSGGAAATLAQNQFNAGHMVLSDDTVYWTIQSGATCDICGVHEALIGTVCEALPQYTYLDNGEVRSVSKAGSSISTIAAAQYHPVDLGIAGNYLYWTQEITTVNGGECTYSLGNTHAINRLSLSTGVVEKVKDAAYQAEHIATTPNAVYYADYNYYSVDRDLSIYSKSGFQQETLIAYESARRSPLPLYENLDYNLIMASGERLFWQRSSTEASLGAVATYPGQIVEILSPNSQIVVCRATMQAVDDSYVYGIVDGSIRRCALP